MEQKPKSLFALRDFKTFRLFNFQTNIYTMKIRISFLFFGMVLLVLAACSSRPLCPAYTDAEPVVVELPEGHS